MKGKIRNPAWGLSALVSIFPDRAPKWNWILATRRPWCLLSSGEAGFQVWSSNEWSLSGGSSFVYRCSNHKLRLANAFASCNQKASGARHSPPSFCRYPTSAHNTRTQIGCLQGRSLPFWLAGVSDGRRSLQVGLVRSSDSIMNKRTHAGMPRPSNRFPSMRYGRSLSRKL